MSAHPSLVPSPSPAIPGAWPATRPGTPASKSSTSVESPLHLDRVTSFHQRLYLSLSDSSSLPPSKHAFGDATATPGGVATPSDSMPGSMLTSDGSDLTRFTPDDNSNSLSFYANTSISTDYNPDRSSLSGVKSSPEDSQINSTSQTSSPSIQLSLSPGEEMFPAFSELLHDIQAKQPAETVTVRPHLPHIIVPSGQSDTTPSSPASGISDAATPTSPMIFSSPTSSQQAFHHHSRSVSYDTAHENYESNTPPLSSSPSPLSCRQGSQKDLDKHEQKQELPEVYLESGRDVPPALPVLTIIPLMDLPPETGLVEMGENKNSPPSTWTLSPISLVPSSPLSVDFRFGQEQGEEHLPPLPVMSPLVACDASLLSTSSLHCPPSVPVMPVSTVGTSSASTSHVLPIPAPLAVSLAAVEEDLASDKSARDYATAIVSSAWGSASDNQLVNEATDFNPEQVALVDPDNNETRRTPLKGPSMTMAMVENVKRFGGRMKKILKNYRIITWKKSPKLGSDSEKTRVGVNIDVNVENAGEPSARGRSLSSTTLPFTEPDGPQPMPPSTPDIRKAPSPHPSSGDAKEKNKMQELRSSDKCEAEMPTAVHSQVPAQAQTDETRKHRRISFFSFGSPSKKASIPTRQRPRSTLVSVISQARPVTVDIRPITAGEPVTAEVDRFMPESPALRPGLTHGGSGPPGLSVVSSSPSTPATAPPFTPVSEYPSRDSSTSKRMRHLSLSAISNWAGLLAHRTASTRDKSEKRRSESSLRARASHTGSERNGP